MFLHVSVILFGGGLPQCMLGYPLPEQCMLGDKGNKRAVRILLECLPVVIIVHNKPVAGHNDLISLLQNHVKRLDNNITVTNTRLSKVISRVSFNSL